MCVTEYLPGTVRTLVPPHSVNRSRAGPAGAVFLARYGACGNRIGGVIWETVFIIDLHLFSRKNYNLRISRSRRMIALDCRVFIMAT
jgi:hypothetical protein